ncbi:hypothetical protein FIBSPDRAFT_723707, partial [Athelia psychrophila]
AQERDERQRDAYQLYLGPNFRADQLVFVDESGVNHVTSKRAYAWSPVGTRARHRDFFYKYSILLVLSLDGVLHLDIIEDSWNGVTFYNLIDALLDNMNPFPQRNSVVVMDNASIHHSPEVRELIEARYDF